MVERKSLSHLQKSQCLNAVNNDMIREGQMKINNVIIKTNIFEKGNIAFNGNKFLMGNGYFGVRGTMEEYGQAGAAVSGTVIIAWLK